MTKSKKANNVIAKMTARELRNLRDAIKSNMAAKIQCVEQEIAKRENAEKLSRMQTYYEELKPYIGKYVLFSTSTAGERNYLYIKRVTRKKDELVIGGYEIKVCVRPSNPNICVFNSSRHAVYNVYYNVPDTLPWMREATEAEVLKDYELVMNRINKLHGRLKKVNQ